VRLDHERRAGGRQALGERVPVVHRKHDAEVAHRHVVAVHGVDRAVARFLGREMRDELMAEEVEVDPLGRAAPFGAAKQAAIERASVVETRDGKG